MCDDLRRNAGESWDNGALAQPGCGGDDAASQAGEVVLVGAAYALDQAVHAQALELPRELRSTELGEDATEIADLEAAQVEFAASESEQERAVIGVEEIEPAPAALLVADGLREAFEVPASGTVVVEAGEEFEITAVGGTEEPGEDAQAVEGLLDGGELGLAAAVAVFHRAVVFEEGDVVGDGLDTQDMAELVVHLQRGAAHLVTDAGALDAGVEVVADLAEVARVELLAQEGGDVLGADGVDGGADQVVVEGSQVLAALEDDVGGVLDLHDAPVVAGRELGGRRAELVREAVELAMQGQRLQPVGDLLRSREVVDVDERVVEELVADVVPLQP